MDILNDAGVANLCEAIVFQAVQDYRRALRGKQVSKYRTPAQTREECEEFFTSSWFEMLTKVKGTYILRELQEEYRNESKSHSKHSGSHRIHF